MDYVTLRCRGMKKEKMYYVKLFCNSFFVIKMLESSLIGEREKLFIVKLAFHILLNHSIPISESKVMVNTQGLFDHTKSDEPKNSNLIFEMTF